jgi:hypothetical protein
MKPEPAPKVEGKTPWEKLDNAVRSVFSVSKDDLIKAEKKAQIKQSRNKKRPSRKVTA